MYNSMTGRGNLTQKKGLSIAVLSMAVFACSITPLQTADLSYSGISVYGLEGESPEQLFTPWLSSVYSYRNDTPGQISFISVSNFQSTASDSVQQHINYRRGEVELDNCLIDGFSGRAHSWEGGSLKRVSAGSNLSVMSGSSPVDSIGGTVNHFYRKNYELAALPKNLTLSYPGDIFPAVSGYSLIDTEPPSGVTPDSHTVIGMDTRYTWQPGETTTSYIEILFYQIDPGGELGDSSMRCNVIDDGEFVLPRAALEWIASSAHPVQVGYFRVARRLDYKDGVVFFQQATAVGDLTGIFK